MSGLQVYTDACALKHVMPLSCISFIASHTLYNILFCYFQVMEARTPNQSGWSALQDTGKDSSHSAVSQSRSSRVTLGSEARESVNSSDSEFGTLTS